MAAGGLEAEVNRLGGDADAILIGVTKESFSGQPYLQAASTSYMERHNLTTRMQLKRVARRVNAFPARTPHAYPVCHREERSEVAISFPWRRPLP